MGNIKSIKFYWWASKNIDKTNQDGETGWSVNASEEVLKQYYLKDSEGNQLVTTGESGNKISIPKSLTGYYIWATIEAEVEGYDGVQYSETAISKIESQDYIAGPVKPIVVSFDASGMGDDLAGFAAEVKVGNTLNALTKESSWMFIIEPEPEASEDALGEGFSTVDNTFINEIIYTWYRGSDDDSWEEIKTGTGDENASYDIQKSDSGKKIKVRYQVKLNDTTNYEWSSVYIEDNDPDYGVYYVTTQEAVAEKILNITDIKLSGSAVYGQLITVSFKITDSDNNVVYQTGE